MLSGIEKFSADGKRGDAICRDNDPKRGPRGVKGIDGNKVKGPRGPHGC